MGHELWTYIAFCVILYSSKSAKLHLFESLRRGIAEREGLAHLNWKENMLLNLEQVVE